MSENKDFKVRDVIEILKAMDPDAVVVVPTVSRAQWEQPLIIQETMAVANPKQSGDKFYYQEAAGAPENANLVTVVSFT